MQYIIELVNQLHNASLVSRFHMNAHYYMIKLILMRKMVYA